MKNMSLSATISICLSLSLSLFSLSLSLSLFLSLSLPFSLSLSLSFCLSLSPSLSLSLSLSLPPSLSLSLSSVHSGLAAPAAGRALARPAQEAHARAALARFPRGSQRAARHARRAGRSIAPFLRRRSVCRSVPPSLRLLLRPSLRRSVRPSVSVVVAAATVRSHIAARRRRVRRSAFRPSQARVTALSLRAARRLHATPRRRRRRATHVVVAQLAEPTARPFFGGKPLRPYARCI